MTTDNDIARIAEGLTKAQREVVTNAWPYPDFHRQGEQVSYCPVWTNERNRVAMERKGLIASMAEGGPRLRPLGFRVRNYLEQRND